MKVVVVIFKAHDHHCAMQTTTWSDCLRFNFYNMCSFWNYCYKNGWNCHCYSNDDHHHQFTLVFNRNNCINNTLFKPKLFLKFTPFPILLVALPLFIIWMHWNYHHNTHDHYYLSSSWIHTTMWSKLFVILNHFYSQLV